MTGQAGSLLVSLAGAWALQALLFLDFAAAVRGDRRPRRVDLLDWDSYHE